MRWKIVGASIPGTSHEKTKKPCQDAFKIEHQAQELNDSIFCFVSDGAGSAIEGGRGAKLVCEGAITFCKETLKHTELTESFGYQLCEHLNALVTYEAKSIGMKVNDFSCTFLGLIVYKEKILYIQIGDGAIVTRYFYESPIYAVVFWPHKGEFANTTYFLTDEDYYKHVVISLKDEIPNSLAVFTDGLEHLSLSNEYHSVHAPFFNSMFAALRKASNQNDIDILNSRLSQFLNSSSINDRTDDDKTLVLISGEYES